MNDIRTFVLIRFSRKSGKIDKSMEGLEGLLTIWALSNTTATKDTIIFDKETGEVVFYAEGTRTFPKVLDLEENDSIEMYCPGLLEAVNEL